MFSGLLSVLFAFAYYLIPLGLAFGIYAIINGARCRRMYKKEPEVFDIGAMRNATIGWIAGIAGICVSILSGAWLLLNDLMTV